MPARRAAGIDSGTALMAVDACSSAVVSSVPVSIRRVEDGGCAGWPGRDSCTPWPPMSRDDRTIGDGPAQLRGR